MGGGARLALAHREATARPRGEGRQVRAQHRRDERAAAEKPKVPQARDDLTTASTRKRTLKGCASAWDGRGSHAAPVGQRWCREQRVWGVESDTRWHAHEKTFAHS